MILSNVNLGTGPSSGDGDPLRSAFSTINTNFQYIVNNVNTLTNSVTSVAGRTGNIVLTVNDVIGAASIAYVNSQLGNVGTYSNINVTAFLPTYTGSIGAVAAANLAMKGYVDASIAGLVDSAPGTLDTLNELAAALGDDPNLSVTLTNTIASANTSMKAYVDGQISAANTLAYSNINTLSYLTTNSYSTQAYVNLANVTMKSYVDGQISAANSAVTAANLGMKGYVDSVAGQSTYGNADVASYLTVYGGNVRAANIIFDDLSIQTTAYTGTQWRSNLESNVTVKPSWLSYVPGGKNQEGTQYGFDTGGMFFTSNADNDFAYPVQTNLHFHQDDVLEIIATIHYTATNNDHGLCIFSTGTRPIWRNGTDGSRIAFQFNTGIPLLYGQTTSNTAPGSSILSVDNYYTIKFIYDPTNTITVETFSGNTATGSALDTRTISEVLPAGDYKLGFDADNDSIGVKSYWTNVTVRTLTNTVVNDLEVQGQVTGNLIPSANVIYDLGNVTHRWRDLWLSGSTIHIGNANISVSNGSIQSSAPIRADITGNITASNITVSGNTISIGGATLDVSSGTLESSVPISTTNLTINGPRLDFVQGAYVEESEIAGNPGHYGLALNSPSDGVVGLNALDVNTQVTSSVIVSNVAVQINVANSTPSGNALMWYFDNTGAVTFPDGTTQATAGSGTATGIVSAETITITNANTSNIADILIQSGDDITLQAKDRLPGNDAEGGDINIYAGDGCDDDGVAGTSSAGDVTIEGGRGGAGNVTSGGSGGFVAIRGGAGGSASLTASAGSGSSISLTAGDAGSNGGDPNLGNLGGDVNIRAGDTNNASDNGGIITLTPGTNAAGANRIAGYVEINIPSSNLGAGGTWTFDGTGRTFNTPQNAEIFGAGAGNLTVGSAGNTLIRSLNYNSLVPYTWQFSDLGVLTLPGEGILQSLNDTVTLVSLNTTSGYANSVYLGSSGGLGFSDSAIGSNWLEIFRSGATPEITSPTGNLKITTVVTGVSSNTWTYGTDGSITFPDNTVQTTAWTGDSYSNVQVATYLPTYTGNINANIATVNSAVSITGAGLAPTDTALFVNGYVNIQGNIDVYGQAQLGNIKLRYGTLIEDSSNGQVVINGNISAGNIFASGTSGQIGYRNGGFVQQATSNATQVTSHFNSGNIQLMSINLGVNAAHTVAFACNKLTTNDMLLIKHVSGGLAAVYIDAYVASDGLAVIWMRNISGIDTGDFSPMLKYAIVQAPSS